MNASYLYLIIINVLVILLYFKVLKLRHLEDIASNIISVSDVEYSFIVRKIRENATTVSLYGLSNIEVRISKEEFEYYNVEVGKIWICDGTSSYCYDPNF